MPIQLFFGLVFIFLFGYLAIANRLVEVKFSERVAISFGMGLGVVSSIFGLMLFFQILYSPSQLFSILGILVAVSAFFIRPSFPEIKKEEMIKSTSIFCVAIIGFLFITSLIFSAWYPVFVTDGNEYEMTGKLIAFNKNLAHENYLRNYPPLVMLAYGFIYFLGGTNPLFIFSLLYICLCVIFYWRLAALGVSNKLSATFTLILGTTPILWWHSFLGLLNLTSGYFFVSGSLFWFTFLKKNIYKGEPEPHGYDDLILAGFFYGLAVFTRPEAMVYFFIPFVLLLYFLRNSKENYKAAYLFILPVLFFGLAWGAYLYYLNLGIPGESHRVSSSTYFLILLGLAVLPLFFRKAIKIRVFYPGNSGNKISAVDRRIYFAILGILIIVLFYFSVDILNLKPANDPLSRLFFSLRVFATMLGSSLLVQFFFGAGCLIFFLTLPLFMNLIHRDSFNKYLLAFIVLGFFLNALVFTELALKNYPDCCSSPTFQNDFSLLIKAAIFLPGSLVNNTQTRSFLNFYPIFLVASALTWRDLGNSSGNKWFFKKKDQFLYVIIFCNLITLTVFFMVPRIQFMASHWGEDKEKLLLTPGPKDNPNMEHLRNIYAAMIEIKNQSEGSHSIYFPTPLFSRAEALKIFFPKKVYLGESSVEAIKAGILKGERKPDCYETYYEGQKSGKSNFDGWLCSKIAHIAIKPSDSHLRKLNMLIQDQ